MMIKVTQVALFKTLNNKILLEYSNFKFGDPVLIKKFAGKVTKVIRKNILKNERCILYTTHKSPLNKYYKKSSLQLAELVAKKLKMRLIIGEYNYRYSSKSFYDNKVKRKRNTYRPNIKNQAALRKQNYHVLMIDDSIVTGAVLKTSLQELKKITDKVTFFSIIDLQDRECSEKTANNSYYTKSGLPFLIKLLKNKLHQPTSQYLRAVNMLTSSEKKQLLETVDVKKRNLLTKAYKIYTKRQL